MTCRTFRLRRSQTREFNRFEQPGPANYLPPAGYKNPLTSTGPQAVSDARIAAVNEQLLSLYSAGRPYHMPPPTASRPGTE